MGKSRLLNNRYKWEKILGQGGMGKVYLMKDLNTQQLVAVKECSCIQEERDVERIKREYYFMTKIQHPHLIRGLDFFQIRNRYFIVMEYVQGITLCDFLRHHPQSISLEKQLQIMTQICDAVATLNRSGIVHRDIKPENIILTPPDLAPKLLDFGIAKAINGELATITKTDNIIGTPDYMTPEQIDRRIKCYENLDVFSLGVVFYQFLAWLPESPFSTGRIVSTLDRIMHYELPPLFANIKTSKEQHISAVISKALKKDPGERIESVSTLQKLICDDSLEIRVAKRQNVVVNKRKTTWKLSRNWRIALWVVINGILLLLLTLGKPVRQITIMKEEFTSRYNSNTTPWMKYYDREIETQKSSRKKWAHAKRGDLFYQMRQLQENYLDKALEDAPKMESVKGQFFLLRIRLLQFIEKAKVQNNASLKTLAKEILQYYSLLKNKRAGVQQSRLLKCAEKIAKHCLERTPRNTLMNTGYGDLYLSCTAPQPGQRIMFLHKAQLFIPDEERVFLELLDAYIECEFFEKAQEMYTLLKKMNRFLVETDFLMVKKYLMVGEFDKVEKTFLKWKTNFWQQQTPWVQVLRIKYLFAVQKPVEHVIDRIDTMLLTTKDKNVIESLQHYHHKTITFWGQYLVVVGVWIELRLFGQAQNLLEKGLQLFYNQSQNDESSERLEGLCALLEVRLMVKKTMTNKNIDQETMENIKRKAKAIFKVGKPIQLHKILTIANFRIWCLQNNVDNMPILDEQRLKELIGSYLFFHVKAREFYYKREYATAILYWDKANDIIPSTHFTNMQKRAFAKFMESKNNEARYVK